MRTLTLQLGQFTFSALILTVLFRYILSLSIESGNAIAIYVCACVYFCLMFFIGWYFGKKDVIENEIYDIGFRFHLVTYILCIGSGYIAYYMGFETGGLKSMNITTISWGLGLLVHFILFLIAQKKTIKGYAKEDIFQ